MEGFSKAYYKGEKNVTLDCLNTDADMMIQNMRMELKPSPITAQH